MIKVTNRAGTEMPFNVTEFLMDDELREELHHKLAPCTEQQFFTAYEDAYEEKFGMEWELSKESPQY